MKIYLLPIGHVKDSVLGPIQKCSKAKFGFETQQLPSLPDPLYAFDSVRKQFNSTLILRNIINSFPADAVKVLAITGKDLFIPMLTFVYGQAQLNGIVALVSFARLHQRFGGCNVKPPLFLSRVLKESLHELGHTFGLTHCINPRCTMSLSINIKQIDCKSGEFCESCLVVLHDSINSIRQGICTHCLTEEEK